VIKAYFSWGYMQMEKSQACKFIICWLSSQVIKKCLKVVTWNVVVRLTLLVAHTTNSLLAMIFAQSFMTKISKMPINGNCKKKKKNTMMPQLF